MIYEVEKRLKKLALKLYKKHITGRGYAWSVGCTMPDDVQAAVMEGMCMMRAELEAERVAIAKAALEAEDVPYMIYFDDRDRGPEIVIGRERALKRYADISVSWNAHLFVKIDSNSRDCGWKNAIDPATIVAKVEGKS